MARVRSGRLALAIFLVALVAVLAAVGLPALLTVAGVTPRAADPAGATLGRGHAALATAERQRLERLALTARLLAREGALIGVLGGASGIAGEDGIDGAAALADLLAQRRPELGFDLALVLDTEGWVLGAAEGGAVAVGSDLASDPLVAVALAEGAAAGTWRAGSALAHVAV
ncbi:MAG TPA: hypothetical protein VM617_06435, partial [Thermoanaerobaculia bacterium]|nr:hypothetical protein [Thermoanaerobaculia bacterium]